MSGQRRSGSGVLGGMPQPKIVALFLAAALLSSCEPQHPSPIKLDGSGAVTADYVTGWIFSVVGVDSVVFHGAAWPEIGHSITEIPDSSGQTRYMVLCVTWGDPIPAGTRLYSWVGRPSPVLVGELRHAFRLDDWRVVR